MAVILFYFVVVVLPVIFWLWFFRSLDKKESEPKPLVRKVFLVGFLAILIAFFAEVFVDGFFGVDGLRESYNGAGFPVFDSTFLLIALSFFLAGPVEEIVKYFVLRRAIFKNPNFNQIADGIIYATALALGFSFFENTGYFIDLYNTLPSEEFAAIVIVRGITATLLHVSVTGIIGLYLGLEKFSPKGSRRLSWKGVFIASMLHGLYNIIVFFPGGLLASFLLVILILGFLVHELRKEDVLKVWFT